MSEPLMWGIGVPAVLMVPFAIIGWVRRDHSKAFLWPILSLAPLVLLLVGLGMSVLPPPNWFSSDPRILTEARAQLHVGLLASALAIFGAMLAWCAILTQRQSARAAATLAHLAKVEFDKDYIDSKATFLRLAKEGRLRMQALSLGSAAAAAANQSPATPGAPPSDTGAGPAGDAGTSGISGQPDPAPQIAETRMEDLALETNQARPDAVKVRTVLNHFELVSLGIQHKIIDYELFKCWNRTTLVYFWREAAPYVLELRKEQNNDRLFVEFEELARDFRDEKPLRRRFR